MVHEECDGLRLISASEGEWMILEMPEELQSAMFNNPEENDKSIEEQSKSLLFLAFEPSLQDKQIEDVEGKLNALKATLNEETFTYLSATVSQKVSACRVLKKLQSEPLSLPLTPLQFQFSQPTLIKALCRRSLHFEAFQISIQMEWDLSPILTDWSYKLVNNTFKKRIILLFRLPCQLIMIGLFGRKFRIK